MKSEIHVSNMVSQLVEGDVPVSEIADVVGVANSTITRIQGKKVDPRYSHFVKIRDLWKERIGSNSDKY
jgi:predicted transcriptional regulator